MLYLIFGQDNFRVKEKLSQIKSKFTENSGTEGRKEFSAGLFASGNEVASDRND